MNATNWIVVCTTAVLGLTVTGSAQQTNVEAVAYKIQETRLGPMDEKVLAPAFSRDGCHLAYVTTRGQKQCVVVDGQAGAEYDGIAAGSMIFSADGKRMAYVAQKGAKQMVVVDGQAGPGVRRNRQRHPDFQCRRQARGVWSPEGREAVRGGGRPSGPEYDGINSLIFSADGKRVAYGAQKGAKRVVVVLDGQAGPEYDGISSLIFSADGKRVAYAAQKGAKWLVVVDSEAGAECDGIGKSTLIFSADGKRVAYVAQKGAKQMVVVDGQAGPEYDGIRSLTFSADGKRVAYAAGKGAKRFVVVDGQVARSTMQSLKARRWLARQQARGVWGQERR